MEITKTVGERIVRLIEYLKITPYQLSKELGYKRPDSIYNVINDKSKMGGNLISKMKDRYETLNINWLMKGTGEMFNKQINAPYGNEIIKDKMIIYPSKLTYEYLKSLSLNFAR